MKVYFIQAGDKGPVKIGKAKNPEARLKTMQTGNPETLRIRAIIVCDSDKHALNLEKDFHFKFRKSRIRGEWFKRRVLKKLRDASVDDFMDKELTRRMESLDGRQYQKYG